MGCLKRLVIQLIALTVFLSLTLVSVAAVIHWLPDKDDSQTITLFIIMAALCLLLASALATLLRRFLLREAGIEANVEEKQKPKRGGA